MRRFCKIRVGENCQKNLTTYVLVSYFLKLPLGFVICMAGIYLKISLGTRFTFLDSYYNSIRVPVALISTGVAMILSAVRGIIFCLKCIQLQSTSELQTVTREHFYLFILSNVTLLSSAVTVFIFVYELQIIHSVFKNGLMDAMSLYSKDTTVKEELDVLQMKYGCCGLESYKDWFYIRWMDDKYLSKNRLEKIKKKSKYFVDDVPFSCCAKTVMRPCINEQVLNDRAHYAYEYLINMTLYKKGCLETLWNFYGKMTFMKIAIFLLIVMCFQVMVIIATRLLQTSIFSLFSGDDPTVGWIISL